MTAKPYPKYKDCDIAWLDKVPEGWEVKKFKYVVKHVSEQTNELLEDEIYVGMENIESWTGNYLQTQSKQDFDSQAKRFYPSYVLFGKLRPYLAKVWLAEFKGVCSGEFLTFSSTKKIISKYLIYSLLDKEFIDLVNSSTYGSKMPRASWNFIGNIKLPLPSISEQQVITAYLDYKCALLETAIQKKALLIEKLKEQKQAIINRAVTKGIKRDVKMKPSGVEWLGDVPEHWEVRRLANIGTFSKGGGISKADLVEVGLPVILYGDLYTKYEIKAEKIVNNISEESAKAAKTICKGDLLFTGSGETREDIGKCVVLYTDKQVYAGGDIIIFSQKSCNSLFLGYALNTDYAKYEKARRSKGEIIVHIYASKLRDIYLPIPPTEEQNEIVRHIENESAKIAKTITRIEREIELLKEYKTSLIAEAVTGKIDVRGWEQRAKSVTLKKSGTV